MELALIQSFLPSRSQGGVGHFADQLGERLGARGHKVTMYSLDPAPAGSGYRVVRPPDAKQWTHCGWGRVYGFALWLAAQDFSRFDVVHAMGDNHLLRTRTPVLRTLSGSALAEAMNARRVRTCAMQLSIYPFELIGAARADQAVGISKATNAHFPGVDIIVPSAVDLEAFHPGAARSPHPSILTVGHRLRDRKRLDLLLAAFRVGVRPLVPDAELWMVCDDPIDEPSVRSYSGLITNELADLYRRAWIFCLPSAYEGFGRPYVEALASGTPVVATPNAGACEVLAGGQYGVLTTPDQLASTLVALIRAPARRARLARAGLGRAEDFSWAQTIVAYETIYEALAAGRKQRGTEVERAS